MPSSRSSSLFRAVRKEAVARALLAGMHLSMRGTRTSVELLRLGTLATAQVCIPLRMRLATNMKCAGLYRRELIERHFERAMDQFGFLMHVFRAGFERSGVPERYRFDSTLDYLREAAAENRGVIVIAPHLCTYPLIPIVLSDYVPCKIYLRHSPDPRKHLINVAVAEAGSAEIVYPPDNATRQERLSVALNVLREKRVLYITPDTPRKPDKGIAVRILDRTVYFPAGVPVMAMRTGALIVMMTWECRNGIYQVRFEPPVDLSGRGDRRARAAAFVRRFGAFVDESIRRQPDIWWNWLDKRWTSVLRNGAINNRR